MNLWIRKNKSQSSKKIGVIVMNEKKIRIRDKSTVSKADYLIAVIIIGDCALVLYLHDDSFVIVNGHAVVDSIVLLVSTMGIIFICSYLFEFQYRRSYWGIFMNAILAILIYKAYVYSTFKIDLLWVYISIAITSIVIIAFFLLRTVRRKSKGVLYRLSLIKAFPVIRGCMILLFSVGFISVSSKNVELENAWADTNDNNMEDMVEVKTYYDDSFSLKNNFQSISRIRDEKLFSELNEQERAELARDIINCEMRYLGVTHSVEFQVVDDAELPENVMACYSESSYEIRYGHDSMMKSDNYKFYYSLAHECFHVYEHDLVNMYLKLWSCVKI